MSNTNPFVESLYRLLDHLNVAYGFLFHLEVQLRAYAAIAKEALKDGPSDPPRLGAGSSLVIADLTDFPSGGGRRKFASGGFATANEEYLKTVEELIGRNAAWVVAQGWERFESFILDTVAIYLSASPQEAKPTELANYSKKNGAPADFVGWRQFAKRAYKGIDNEDLLNFLRSKAPQLGVAEQNNNRDLPIVSWYKAAAKVRHAVTHSDSTITPGELAKLDAPSKDLLLEYFPGTMELSGGYRLTLSSQDARAALELFAEYAFAIFKAISSHGGHAWDILEEGRQITIRGI